MNQLSSATGALTSQERARLHHHVRGSDLARVFGSQRRLTDLVAAHLDGAQSGVLDVVNCGADCGSKAGSLADEVPATVTRRDLEDCVGATGIKERIKVIVVLVQNHGFHSIGSLSESLGSQRFGTRYRYRDEVSGRLDGAPLPVVSWGDLSITVNVDTNTLSTGQLMVTTDAGVVRTGTVVCAAGPWSRAVGAMGGVDLPVQPLRRQILITEPLGDDLLASLPPSMPMTIDAASTFYLHREGPAVLLGMSYQDEEPGFRLGYSEDWLPALMAAVERRCPGNRWRRPRRARPGPQARRFRPGGSCPARPPRRSGRAAAPAR